MKYLTPLVLVFCLSACEESGLGADNIIPGESIQGEYGPKDWRQSVNPQFCTELNGSWSCADTGNVTPIACMGAQWIGGVFTLKENNVIVNGLADSTYDLTGNHLSWFPSGLHFDVYVLDSQRVVLDFQPGCAMLYEKL